MCPDTRACFLQCIVLGLIDTQFHSPVRGDHMTVYPCTKHAFRLASQKSILYGANDRSQNHCGSPSPRCRQLVPSGLCLKNLSFCGRKTGSR